MTGALVISLDFELMWGVRDHTSRDAYGDAVLGGRKAIPEVLSRFERAGVRATWATVGLLFARTRDEMIAYAPERRPSYLDAALSPYFDIANLIGRNEAEDPLHFGRSLLDLVRNTDGQEIATHTFSHYYCLEPGPVIQDFEADLAAALRIAGEAGVAIRSIVFPRDQMSDAHISSCRAQGIAIWRGKPKAYVYRPLPRSNDGFLNRAMRLADCFLPVAGDLTFAAPQVSDDGTVNARASRFLRPASTLPYGLYDLHLAKVLSEIRMAAKQGRVYHLWWHPHNFGRAMEQNLYGLDRILDCLRDMREAFGMRSLSMGDLGAIALRAE